MSFVAVSQSRSFARRARILLGAVFLTAGIAKIPVLRDFGFALGTIARLGPEVTPWVAAGVLMGEIALGLMLCLGWCVTEAGYGALLMSVVFAGVQSARLVSGRGAPCYCLGVLGNLPAGVELGLDLLLLLLSIVVLRGAGRAGSRRGMGGGGRLAWLAIIIPICVLSMQLFLPGTPGPDGGIILRKLKGGESPGIVDRRKLVLCVNLDYLHCPLCFDDLVFLLDTLRAADIPAEEKDVAAIFRMGEVADSSGWRVRRWARETGITGSIAVVSAEEFDDATGGKSVLWLAEGMERIVRAWELPLGIAHRGEVVAVLGR